MPEQPPECRRSQAQLTDYLEDALAGEQQAAVSKHLAACASCREVLTELQHTIRLLGKLRGIAPPTPNPAHLPDRQGEAS